MYQTMTEKALVTVEVHVTELVQICPYHFPCLTTLIHVQTNWVLNREFILVLVAANYSICHDPPLNQADLCVFQQCVHGFNL